MDLEDFFQPEVGIAAAVVAALASPRVPNKVLRHGAVFGLAGILIAGDTVKQAAGQMGRTMQQVVTHAQAQAQAQAQHAQLAEGTASTQVTQQQGGSAPATSPHVDHADHADNEEHTA